MTEAAEFLWSLLHVRGWDDLVVEHGWSPERFVQCKIDVAKRALIGAPITAAPGPRSRPARRS